MKIDQGSLGKDTIYLAKINWTSNKVSLQVKIALLIGKYLKLARIKGIQIHGQRTGKGLLYYILSLFFNK